MSIIRLPNYNLSALALAKKMEKRLCEAALEGNLISFRNLLQEDALLLDRFITGCYPETPLHIVSMLGHIDLVEEILARKPELTKQLNIQKISPLHLATAKGYLDIVKRLVETNPDMCVVCDQDGRIPLYIAATKGHTVILEKLFQAKPRAAWFLMDGGETILHACIRSNHFQAMKFLVEQDIADHEFVNSKNCDGNTVLHLAVADKQIEAVNFLIANTTVEVNSLNSDGFTTLDLLSERDVIDKQIAESLKSIGAVNARNTPLSIHELRAIRTKILTSPTCNRIQPLNTRKKKKVGRKFGRRHDDWLERKRSSLMVVASLLATMAFQAAMNPPGGVWQDTNKDHTAGFSIMADNFPTDYHRFLMYNTTGFVASLSIILLLISGLPLKRRFFMWILMIIMWIAITAMALTYVTVISDFTPDHQYSAVVKVIVIGQLVWSGLMLLLLLGHTIRLIIRMIKLLFRTFVRRRGPSQAQQP